MAWLVLLETEANVLVPADVSKGLVCEEQRDLLRTSMTPFALEEGKREEGRTRGACSASGPAVLDDRPRNSGLVFPPVLSDLVAREAVRRLFRPAHVTVGNRVLRSLVMCCRGVGKIVCAARSQPTKVACRWRQGHSRYSRCRVVRNTGHVPVVVGCSSVHLCCALPRV